MRSLEYVSLAAGAATVKENWCAFLTFLPGIYALEEIAVLQGIKIDAYIDYRETLSASDPGLA